MNIENIKKHIDSTIVSTILKKITTSPLSQLSFGLVMLTITLLFTSEFFGLVPDTKKAELQARKVITETLAIQLSMDLETQSINKIRESLRNVVERNNNILSGAIRKNSGEILVQIDEHDKNWTLTTEDKSTTTELQVSLFDGNQRWGNVELRFTEIGKGGTIFSFRGSFIFLIIFMAFLGFIAYRLFLKRALKELDPDAVIPDRVRKALDTLSEGLIIIDSENTIIFSNEAFAQKTGFMPEQLIGKNCDEFKWESPTSAYDALSDDEHQEFPWNQVMQGEELTHGVRLRLTTALDTNYIFNVNVSPITTDSDVIRGALVTFDDVTEIEMKNEELRQAFGKLEETQHEIMQQNKELLTLATRDPLTNLLNRRSLFESFEAILTEIIDEGGDLSCIMVDIDHFKAVNDNYGHSVGDIVIKALAKILDQHSHEDDLVGRLGGEEFVVVMPNANEQQCAEVAEHMRLAVTEASANSVEDIPEITSSFGVATLNKDINDANHLLELADKALYAAKETGRNRVICFSDDMYDGAEPEVLITQPKEKSRGVNRNIRSTDRDSNTDLAAGNDNNFHTDPGLPAELIEEPRVSCPPDKVLLLERINKAINRVEKYQAKVAVLAVDIDALQRVNDTLGIISTEKFAKTIVARIKDTLKNSNANEINEDLDTINENGSPQLNLSEDEINELKQLSEPNALKNAANPGASPEQNKLDRNKPLSFNVTRLNNNDIIILLTDLDQGALITSHLYNIFSANEAPVSQEGHEFYLNTNIGISLFPSNGDDAETLLMNATSAMQEAKRKLGRNSFEFYTDEIGQRSQKLMKMETELHQAIERNEFSVRYQPRVDLSSGKILGMEALIRWEHPQLGVISPEEFIPVAEQTGLIREITQWMIRTTSRQVLFWHETGFKKAAVSINLSPSDFQSLDLAEQIITIVRDTGISPEFIDFEITETVVMHSVDATLAILEKLSKAGFTITLDDFGTGYSSLSYLKKFPVTKIKIDSSFIKDFVTDSQDAAIVTSLISMSHSLDLRVVAEGLENEEQLHFLQDLKCDEAQGYLISGALSTPEATSLLEDPSKIRNMVTSYTGDNVISLNDLKTGTR